MDDWPENTDDHRPERGKVKGPPAHSEGPKEWVGEKRIPKLRGL